MLIGVTQGDANGVGPEIIVRALAEPNAHTPCLVFGDIAVLQRAAEAVSINASIRVYDGQFDPEAINVVDHQCLAADDVQPGKVAANAGRAAIRYLDSVIDAVKDGRIDAIVTLPINKESTRLSTPGFQGHTDYLAQQCGVEHYTMMLAAPKLIVTHVSMHVSLREAIDLLSVERIVDLVRLTAPTVEKLRGRAKLAVAGLNPHSGEAGAFGDEDMNIIAPAVAQAIEQGFDVHGPQPPDTVFMHAVQGRYDAVLCMYHDQGHIPMKLLSFHDGVNVTLGLPIVRTSVDHGTAFDIAYQGVASTQNFIAALKMAEQLSEAE